MLLDVGVSHDNRQPSARSKPADRQLSALLSTATDGHQDRQLFHAGGRKDRLRLFRMRCVAGAAASADQPGSRLKRQRNASSTTPASSAAAPTSIKAKNNLGSIRRNQIRQGKVSRRRKKPAQSLGRRLFLTAVAGAVLFSDPALPLRMKRSTVQSCPSPTRRAPRGASQACSDGQLIACTANAT